MDRGADPDHHDAVHEHGSAKAQRTPAPGRNEITAVFLARGFSERQIQKMAAQSARRSAASYFGPTGLPGQAGGAQAGQPGLAHSPLFTHTGSGDTTRPGHVADDYNLPVPPQADPAPRPDGEDVTLDSDL